MNCDFGSGTFIGRNWVDCVGMSWRMNVSQTGMGLGIG
jgi:hypothetical protein